MNSFDRETDVILARVGFSHLRELSERKSRKMRKRRITDEPQDSRTRIREIDEFEDPREYVCHHAEVANVHARGPPCAYLIPRYRTSLVFRAMAQREATAFVMHEATYFRMIISLS